MTSYTLTLDYRGECTDPVPTVRVDDVSTTQYMFSGLEQLSDYQLTITASNQAGDSPPGTLTATTLPTAPSNPVQNLMVSSSNSTSITIQWDRVECIERNSNITGYEVSYGVGTTFSTSRDIFGTDMRNFTASNLIPRTQYIFGVVPVSVSGNGRSRTVTQMTDSSTSEFVGSVSMVIL